MYGLKPVVLVPVVPALATGVAARRGGASHLVDVSAKNHATLKIRRRGLWSLRARAFFNLSVFHHNDICNHDRFLNVKFGKGKFCRFSPTN